MDSTTTPPGGAPLTIGAMGWEKSRRRMQTQEFGPQIRGKSNYKVGRHHVRLTTGLLEVMVPY